MVELKDRKTLGMDLADGCAVSQLYQTKHSGEDVFFLVREVSGDSVIIDTYDNKGKKVLKGMSVPVTNLSDKYRADQSYQDLVGRLS